MRCLFTLLATLVAAAFAAPSAVRLRLTDKFKLPLLLRRLGRPIGLAGIGGGAA
jgi:hypothetical protein